MIHYKALEMHAHTLHSDGTFTVEGLCRAGKARELDGVALTDHNTLSGHGEATPQLERETLPLIQGIEWTTFYGHMLVIGAERFVDWRNATPSTIDTFTRAIREAQGAVGIAHPFALGSPFCTGCYWEYNVQDWSQVDYVEVWSGPHPQHNPINDLALQYWTDLLNRGHRLAASCGRDWHGPDKGPAPHMPVTYVGVEEGGVNTRTVREALRAGRTCVTSGPSVSLSVAQNSRVYGIGDEVKPGKATLRLEVDLRTRASQWAGFGIGPRKVHIVQNGAPVRSFDCTEDLTQHGEAELDLWPGWLRLEVEGEYMQKSSQLLAFTSPVYVG